jgi:hypothetical protein
VKWLDLRRVRWRFWVLLPLYLFVGGFLGLVFGSHEGPVREVTCFYGGLIGAVVLDVVVELAWSELRWRFWVLLPLYLFAGGFFGLWLGSFEGPVRQVTWFYGGLIVAVVLCVVVERARSDRGRTEPSGAPYPLPPLEYQEKFHPSAGPSQEGISAGGPEEGQR